MARAQTFSDSLNEMKAGTCSFCLGNRTKLEENKFAHVVKHVVNFQKPLRPLRLEAQLMTRTNS